MVINLLLDCVVITMNDMKNTFLSPSELHGIAMSKKRLMQPQVHTSLGHQGRCRILWEGLNFLNYVQHVFPRGQKNLNRCFATHWVAIPTARGQTSQGHDSFSGLTQLVKSWESLACLQLCSGSPVGWRWKPCSYRLAAQWWRSCLQWTSRCSAGVCWVMGHLRHHFCCHALRRVYYDPSYAEHIQRG